MKIKQGDYIHLKKMSIAPNPRSPTGKKSTYKYGKENPGVSVPVDYWIEGVVWTEPKVGSPLFVFRLIRNGVESEGMFNTSPITSIKGNSFNTLNSVYKIRKKKLPKKYESFTL